MSAAAVSLVGRTVAVTGGAHGIGRAAAAHFAKQGAKVAIGDLDAAAAEDSAVAAGAGAVGLPLDVSDRDSFIGFLDAVEQRLGPIDVLVNNAGIDWMGPFHEEPDEVTRREVEVNLMGTINGTRLALKRMLPRARGHIVNVSSGAGRLPLPGSSSYSATKHAIVGLTESLRLEYQGSGVQFSLIQPGQVTTAMMDGQPRPRLSKIVTAEDVAAGIVDAVVRGRFEVWVPAANAAGARIAGVMPRVIRDPLFRAAGLTKIAGEVDSSSRHSYHERMFGRS